MPAMAGPAMAQSTPQSTTPHTTAPVPPHPPVSPMTTPAPSATAPMTRGTTTRTAPANGIATAGGDRASKIIGASVTNEKKETVGTVDDLIINADEKVPSAVLSVGGFLGIGTKYVEVPFDQLTISGQGVMMAGATKESLKALPEFKYQP
jgi:sporulation protein YlmC with PRC-barrel domain